MSVVKRNNLIFFFFFCFVESNVLFNDALKTFDLRLYGVRHVVNDHSDSERRNPLLPLRGEQGFLYMHHPTYRRIYTTAFVTPVVEHGLEREIANRLTMKDRSDDTSHHEQTLLPRSYVSLLRPSILIYSNGFHIQGRTKRVDRVDSVQGPHWFGDPSLVLSMGPRRSCYVRVDIKAVLHANNRVSI